MDRNKPFSGLKILDLSSVLAGPLTGSFFAELGAEVTKIENKLTGGDVTRQWKTSNENSEYAYSAYYFSANYGKNVLLLDLTTEQDKRCLQNLVKVSDVVIMNYQKDVAVKLGLTPKDLANLNPKLIIAQLNAYEYDDPRLGYDLIMQGETGWISMTGTDLNNLAKLPVALIDVLASHQLKEAVLIALAKKKTNDQAWIIHVSLFKTALSALANQATNYLMNGLIPEPMGTLHPNISPYGDVFKDVEHHKFMIAVGSDAQFEKLWETLGLDVEKLSIFEINKNRVKGRKNLFDLLQKEFSNLKYEESKDQEEKEI